MPINRSRTVGSASHIFHWLVLGFLVAAGTLALSGAEAQVRATALPVISGQRSGFTLMDPAVTGVTFTNRLTGDAYFTNAVAHNGSGVAIGDVDGDGWPDLYLCGLNGTNQLYRNLGQWRFEPMPLGEAACLGQMSTGAVLVDVDGDADLDLLVNGIAAGTRLFLNDGHGRWTEKRDSGLYRHTTGTSMALADMDGDGDLDLYCVHYIDVMHMIDPSTRFAMSQQGGRWVVSQVNGIPTTDPRFRDRFEVMPDGEVVELPEADALYRNDGHGRFTPVQAEPGVFLDDQGKPEPMTRDWGLAVVFRDLDGDGSADLYVSNDFASPDRLWFNDGRGHFRAAPPQTLRHACFNSMGIDVADVNRDGHDDILVVDLLATRHERRMRQLGKTPPDPVARESLTGRPQFNRNMLFLGRPGGRYVEAALSAGLAASDWSWCPVFLDVDLDGYEDLLVSNGFEYDLMDSDTQDRVKDPSRTLSPEQRKRWMKLYPEWRTANLAFRNRGDGTFEPKSAEWGFREEGLAFGMALGDLDQDGDLDLVVNRINGSVEVHRNEATAPRIAVELKGRSPNTAGLGAKIRLIAPTVSQGQELVAGGRYLSGDQALRVFAVPAPVSTNPASVLEIRWRSGAISRIERPLANHRYEVSEPTDRASSTSPVRPALPSPLFEDVSALLGPAPGGEPFDDALIQPLIPHRMSRQGPGLAWTDLDGDGWEDLVHGARRGGRSIVFKNLQGKGFSRTESPESPGGQRGVAAWSDGLGGRHWLASAVHLNARGETVGQLIMNPAASGAAPRTIEIGPDFNGPLAVGDVDGDSDLDVVVGGQFRLGRYPEAVPTTVWMNEGGVLQGAPDWGRPMSRAGCVNGATLVDLDGDGDLDLALAVEWEPVRLYRNEGGQFRDMTAPMRLAGRTGWWQGIAAGDFDGDGRMDLAVANVGRNTAYALFSPGPIRLYHGEWNTPGRVELLEAWQREGAWLPIKNRTQLTASLPDLPARFPTHEAFGRADVPRVLGESAARASFLEAVEFDSGVFLNRTNRFEWRPFPREAQWSPASSLNVADVDGDGFEDVFLSQNRSDLLPEWSRDDSGSGLWLRGRGDGSFQAMDPAVSGIRIEGEQRAAALADFDHDRRIDVVVSQINGPTVLWANRRARPGLRVVLEGPPANPEVIGAQVRLRFADGHSGPVRAVQGGSGFGSQDAAPLLMGMPSTAAAVWVRWPGGREQEVPVRPDQTEVRIRWASP